MTPPDYADLERLLAHLRWTADGMKHTDVNGWQHVEAAAAALPSLLEERRQTRALAERLAATLSEIAASHLPSQPAALNMPDLAWAMQHIGRLRRIATGALADARSAGLLPETAKEGT